MGEAEVVALLRNLIASRTVNPPGDELEGAQVLQEYLEGKGVPAEIDEFAPGRANLKAEVGDGDRVLLLTSHLDVVSPGREDLWRGDPFRLRKEGNRLYGRGTSDAKGSLAAMAVAVAELAQECPSGRVRFAAVAGEEVDGLGSRRLVQQRFLGDGVVVGEPTGLRVMTAHKGRLRVTLEIPGRAAHASQPQEGINPIPRAAEVISGMEPLCRAFSERSHPLLGPESLVFTVVRAGEKANMIPDSCLLQMDARVVPPWTVEEAAGEIETFVQKLSDVLGFSISVRVEPLGRPANTPPEEPLVRAALEAVQACGIPQKAPEGFRACCDMQHFRGAGAPTVVLGPGELSRAHTTDESVTEDELILAVRVYKELARRFLC